MNFKTAKLIWDQSPEIRPYGFSTYQLREETDYWCFHNYIALPIIVKSRFPIEIVAK
jgi:hypothetical protein